MDAKKTGALIAQLRKERGYTQKDLAELLHVSDKAISRWETGKGYPDTALLKPLSDALGIGVSELLAGEMIPREKLPEQVDAVIVASLQHSKKQQRRGMFWFCLMLTLVVVLGIWGLWDRALRPAPVDIFINQSKTSIRYELGMEYGGTAFFDAPVYTDLINHPQVYGFEFMKLDGSERYVFTNDDQLNKVLSYIHCSQEGMLFGFRIGDATVLRGNDALGVSGYSLIDYLEEQGFRWEHGNDEQYGRPTLVYVDGERCNWFPYVKDGVYINLCLSAYEGRKLVAFDIGLCDERNARLWEQLEEGYSFTVKDPSELLTENPSGKYPQWTPVTLTAAVPEGQYETLYCYLSVGDSREFLGKFEKVNGLYQITVSAPGVHCAVLVTPEAQE